MSTKRPIKRANQRSFPGYVPKREREPGLQANKDDNKRRQVANKRRKTIKLRASQKASRIASRRKH